MWLWEGMAGRNPVCLGESQQGAKLMGKGDFVAAGREGEEARADVGGSGCWMEPRAEFETLV